MAFGAWPRCPGNIKGIFPEVVNSNLGGRHHARGIGQIQKNRGERWVQEVKVVTAGWLSSWDGLLTRSEKEEPK